MPKGSNSYFPREPEGTWANEIKNAPIEEIIEALGPVLGDLKTEPRDHQYRALAISASEDAWLFASEMGSGKTKISIDTYTIRRGVGDFTGQCLVLAMPVGQLHWENEVLKHSDWSVQSIEGTSKKKLDSFLSADADFVVVSVFWLARLLGRADKDPVLKARLNGAFADYSMLVLDESHKVAAGTGQYFSRLSAYLGEIPYTYLLTGTPIGNNYMNIWGLYYYMDTSVYGDNYNNFLHDWFTSFVIRGKNRSFWSSFKMYRLTSDPVLKEGFFKLFWTRAVRWEEAELVGLPSKSYIRLPIEMDPQQAKLYDAVLNDDTLKFDKRKYELMRITAGCHPDIKAKMVPKLEALLELITEKCIDQDDQILVWHWLVEEGVYLEKAIGILLGKAKVASVRGETTEAARRKALSGWKAKRVRCIVANPDSLGTSVDLYETNVSVYYSNSVSIIHRKQSEKRIHRDGQGRPCTWYDLITPSTIDQQRFDTISARERQFVKLTGDKELNYLRQQRRKK